MSGIDKETGTPCYDTREAYDRILRFLDTHPHESSEEFADFYNTLARFRDNAERVESVVLSGGKWVRDLLWEYRQDGNDSLAPRGLIALKHGYEIEEGR